MTYPLATLAASLTPAGISAPSYEEILTSLQVSFRQIFGSDAYLEADSADGQLLALFAKGIHDSNQMAVAVYQGFRPSFAQGAALDGVVRINGVVRRESSRSTVTVVLSGAVGAMVTNGKVRGPDGLLWSLPASVVIGSGGSVSTTATCDTEGPVAASIGTLTSIATPTYGWTSVTNSGAASPGVAVESDAELRLRRDGSVALSSTTILQGLRGALAALPGVTQAAVLENDSGSTDADGIPAHHICAVVAGGVAADVADTIRRYKSIGVGTHGTTTTNVTDELGNTIAIKYYRPTTVTIKVQIVATTFTGWTSVISDEIKAAIVAYVNALPFGQDVFYTRMFSPALLSGGSESQYYHITSLQIAKNAGAFGSSDIAIAFNEQPVCTTADVTVTV